MKTFLYSVAEDLLQKMKEAGEDLTQTTIIFPNKRAGLFFNEYIARQAEGKPIWSPNYMTISDLFTSLSPRKIGDSILLVCELYQEYARLTNSNETLDHFYGWGEIILKDFDDVDKNRVNASALFHNLDDLKGIELLMDYLSDEQKETIRHFFTHFKDQNETVLKQQFRAFWNSLAELYTCFNKRLKSEGIAYEGALYREVAESFDTESLPARHYAFVGFNVLNAVEHTLLEKIQKAGKAWFYWDYDTYYLKDKRQEAGWFINQDIKDFPNELPEDIFHNLDKTKEITYVSAPTGNAQVRYLPQWLSKNLTTPEKETAIVLCDENFLQPVLHSIPDNVKEINVTMGFPLTNTPVYSLLTAALELQERGYDADEDRFHYEQAANVLKHPYLQLLTPDAESLLESLTKSNRFFPLRSELTKDGGILEFIFQMPENTIIGRINYLSDLLKKVATTFNDKAEKGHRMENQLYRESLFKAFTTLERFHKLVEDHVLQVAGFHTLARLIIRVLSGISIPFHGEPAKGLQVMGVLETRNLDFKHLIMLSVNEGNLPKGINDNSLIPYNLRVAYGLTTIRHQVSVYAYYFYRLLQRAEKITLIYNEGNAGIGNSEMSRFMLQYKMESGKAIQEQSLSPAITPTMPEIICVEKTKEMLDRLAESHNDSNHYFSPTALNCYLACPLKFYFTYIGRMREEEEVSSVVDPRYFGNIFHRAAELLYNNEKGKIITTQMLENVEKNKIYERCVNQAFNEEFFHLGKDENAHYNGEQLIKRDIIQQYIRQLITYDKQQHDFRIMGLEENVHHQMKIITSGKDSYIITIGGKIDRRDQLTSKDGTGKYNRIVDYKTGGSPQTFKSVEQLFTRSPLRPDKIFQTFIYAYLAHEELGVDNLVPALFFVHKSSKEKEYTPELTLNKSLVVFDKLHEEFKKQLQSLLMDIFDLETPFTQTEDTSVCSYCPFIHLCRR